MSSWLTISSLPCLRFPINCFGIFILTTQISCPSILPFKSEITSSGRNKLTKSIFKELYKNLKSNLNKIPEDNNTNEVDESPSPIISDSLEMINGFESYKITLVDEDGSEQFIWVANTLRKSNTAKMMQEKIEAYERSWMNFDGDFSEMGIDPDGIIVKAIFGDSEGSFEYNLTKYIDTDTPPEIFNQPKNFKKVKKLKMF